VAVGVFFTFRSLLLSVLLSTHGVFRQPLPPPHPPFPRVQWRLPNADAPVGPFFSKSQYLLTLTAREIVLFQWLNVIPPVPPLPVLPLSTISQGYPSMDENFFQSGVSPIQTTEKTQKHVPIGALSFFPHIYSLTPPPMWKFTSEIETRPFNPCDTPRSDFPPLKSVLIFRVGLHPFPRRNDVSNVNVKFPLSSPSPASLPRLKVLGFSVTFFLRCY